MTPITTVDRTTEPHVTARPTLAVVLFSESFSILWRELADELEAVLWTGPTDADVPAHATALILACGGEEEHALDYLAALAPHAGRPTFVAGARPSHRFAVETLRRGGTDYFVLPADVDLLRRTLAARVSAQRERRAHDPRRGDMAFEGILGDSPALRGALEKAARVLQHRDVTVLLGGETGTGKELLARALHEGGPRAAGPFVAVNCAAIPATLLESELFGHERGAFTDAHRAKPGLFEEADGGTLFLDEIGHLPLPLQGKLLRALDDRQIRRVGSTHSRGVDVRIIAATHVDLRDAVARGEFREDLYYRLNVVGITLPPLRRRDDDIRVLAEVFVRSLAQRYNLAVPPLTASVLEALRAHQWPGNVRELRHTIERALLLSPPGTLDPGELAFEGATRGGDAPGGAVLPFPATLDTILGAAAQAAVTRHGGNKSAAARELGISRARLQRLLDAEPEAHGRGA